MLKIILLFTCLRFEKRKLKYFRKMFDAVIRELCYKLFSPTNMNLNNPNL